jgi:hypothetical protein
MENTTIKNELIKFLQIKTTEEFNRQNQILNELILNPSSIKQLLLLMENDEVHSLQQLMTILLKKSISKKYLTLPPNEQQEIKQTLLVKYIVMSTRFSENILKQLCEAVGAICRLENIKLENWPELKKIVTEGLEFSDKAKTLKALCLLDSVLELDHDYFTFEDGQAIYSRLVMIFGNAYNSELDSLYLLSLKLMAILGYGLIENEMSKIEKEKEIVKSFLLSIHTMCNFPGYVENNLAEVEKNLLFVYEGMDESLNHFSHKWESSKEMVVEFMLSDSMITNPHFTIGLKSTGCDILLGALEKYRDFFAKDRKDTTLFQKIFKIFFDILLAEEKQCVMKLAQDPEYTELRYTREQRHANYIFTAFKMIANEYSYKSMYQLVKELFKSLGDHPRLQLRLLFSVNEGFYAHISREFDVYFEFVFNKLTTGIYSEKIYALRSMSFFLENNTLKVLDKFTELMNCLMLSLDQLSQGPFDEKAINIFDEIMIVLELLVENGESENVEAFGFDLLQKLTQFVQNKSLNLNLRKLALRVVSALLTSLTQVQIEEIYAGLMGILAQSCLEDYLVSESLIAIGRLSYYHLKDYTDQANKLAIYEKMYANFVKKAAELCSNPKAITDNELLEGAYSSLYFAVMTLKRDSINLVPPKVILLTVEYIESRALIVPDEAPMSENEDPEAEAKENLAAYLSNLSYKSMLVAALHLIGHSMQTIPDHVLKESVDPMVAVNRMKQLIMEQELDNNEDVRCQAFKALSQTSQGLLQWCNINIIQDFMNMFQDFAINEMSNLVINRYFSIFNEWINEMKDLIAANKMTPDVFFSSNMLMQIANCIHSVLKKQEGYLDPDVLSIICLVNESISSPMIASEYKTNLASKYGNIKVYPRLASKYMTLPEQLSTLVFEYIKSIYTLTFEPLINVPEDMDLMCIEELIGSLAELINKLGMPLVMLGQEIFPQVSLIDIIFNLSQLQEEGVDRNISFLLGVLYMFMPNNIFGDRLGASVNLLSSFYQKYPDNAAIKDNCLSSMCKLYLNTNVSDQVQTLLTQENLVSQIESSVPMQGDPQEANYLWKVLLKCSQNDKEGFENKILNSPRLLSFVLKTLVYEKALIDDQIYDWLLGLAKSSSAQVPLRNLTGSLDTSSKSKLAQVLN